MNTITRERIQSLAEQLANCRYVDPREVQELARIALASLEAEPVPGLFIKCTNIEPRPGEVTIAQATPMANGEYHDSCFHLYAAPPAPVDKNPLREFAREYIESWELGMAGDSGLLVSARKAIAASEILQPATASVPDENGLLPCPCCGGKAEFDYDDDNLNWISCNVCGISTDTAYHTDVDARDKLRELWNRRAAMLQGADGTLTNEGTIPANTPCKEAPEHIWLQTAGVWPENGEFSELTWCSDNQHTDDTLYVRADVVAGNSPAIPDGWVACSERMPEIGQKVFYYFDIVGVHAGYYDGDNTFVKENGGGWLTGDVTHWMEWILPAAPKREA